MPPHLPVLLLAFAAFILAMIFATAGFSGSMIAVPVALAFLAIAGLGFATALALRKLHERLKKLEERTKQDS